MFGAGATASPLMLEAMAASPVGGGMPYGRAAGKIGQQMLDQQMQQQPQPGMGQRPMSMDASNQMPANGVPQFNPRANAGTIGGAEFMRRRRGLA